MTDFERYASQLVIDGWGEGLQMQLQKGHVAVVGQNACSDWFLLLANLMGIGHLRLIVTSSHEPASEAPFLRLSKQETHVERLKEVFHKVGEGSLEVIVSGMCGFGDDSLFLSGQDAILDLSGQPTVRASSLRAAQRAGKYCELVHFDETGFRFSNNTKHENPYTLRTPWHEPDPVVAAAAAATALGEIKGFVFGSEKLRQPVYFPFHNACAGHNYGGLRALVVGAGGNGGYVGPLLAALGVKHATFMDKDTFEVANLNRQILGNWAIGKPKAVATAELCNLIAGSGADYRAVVGNFDSGTDISDFDVVLGCVDNDTARYWMWKKSLGKVPYMDGGTEIYGGRVVAQIPGETRCLGDMFKLGDRRIAEQAAQEQQARLGRCDVRRDPQIVMPNVATAALIVRALQQHLEPETFGRVVSGQTRYDSLGTRFGTIGEAPCGH